MRKTGLYLVLILGLCIALFMYFGRQVAFFDPLDEGSALVASSRYPGVFWTLNDSGGDPVVFAINDRRELIAQMWVSGAENTDWESISIDDSGHLLVMDSGNNGNERRDLCVYRFAEPDVLALSDTTTASGDGDRLDPAPFDIMMARNAERFEFRYPEQHAFPDDEVMNFDSEASFYHPGDEAHPGQLYLLTKHRSDTRTVLYAFPELVSGHQLDLIKIDAFDVGGDDDWFGGRVTGADLHADSARLAVLTYHRIFVFDISQRPVRFGDPIASIALVQSETQQVEGIAWSGDTLLVLNEQGTLWHLPFELWSTPDVVFPLSR
jgi:hypothetical protein